MRWLGYRSWAAPAALLLVAAAVIGQWIAARPMNSATLAVVMHVTENCHLDVAGATRPITVWDSAHHIDRCAWQAVARWVVRERACRVRRPEGRCVSVDRTGAAPRQRAAARRARPRLSKGNG